MIVLYARVSGHDQKEDLQRQVQQLEQWALVARSGQLTLTLTDIGLGLDTERKNLQRLLTLVQDYQVAEVVVTFSDRLTRFGLSYLRSLFSGLEQLTRSLNSAILSSTLMHRCMHPIALMSRDKPLSYTGSGAMLLFPSQGCRSQLTAM